jgi:hypothetical protein
MENTKELVIRIPEALAAQVNLLLKISGGGINELAVELFTKYTEQSIQVLAQRKAVVSLDSNKERTVITQQMIEASYKVAKEVYIGSLTRSEGKSKIHELTGMNIGSAQDYINDFLAMMSGEVYYRTMSTDATDYFLRHIFTDYGVDQFKLAVGATKKHIKYYESVSGAPSLKRVKLIEKLLKELLNL